MSACHSTHPQSSARSNAVSRLFGGFRGWLGAEIHALRVAQLDDAFFATTKGMQYLPKRLGGILDDRRSAA
jgi:hypothetical protein